MRDGLPHHAGYIAPVETIENVSSRLRVYDLEQQKTDTIAEAVSDFWVGRFAKTMLYISGERVRVLHTKLDPALQPRSGGPGLYRENLQWFADCADGKVLRLLELETSPELERRAAIGKKIALG